MDQLIYDSRFRVEVIATVPNPQTVCWLAARNDYSETFVFDQEWISEKKAGKFLVNKILPVGHYGVLEHPQIVFALNGFPHSTVMQGRTHRTGISWDVQSSRYTGSRIIKVAEGELDAEDVFYLRPVGSYTDRQGKHYNYTSELRAKHLDAIMADCMQYREDIALGLSEEHARSTLAHDLRQNCVVSMNLRTALHFHALRAPKDAQLEIRTLCDMMYPHLESWCPELMAWHVKKLKGKSKLAP